MGSLQLPEFGTLERLKNYLATVRRRHVPTMRHYRSEDNKGFFHQPRFRKEASRSSTATCVSSLVQAGHWKEGLPWWDDTSRIAARLIRRPWESAELERDNPFTLSFIVEGILDLQQARPVYKRAAHHLVVIKSDAVPILRKAIKNGAISISPYPASAYLTQLTYRVLQRLNALNAKLTNAVHRWSRAEISKQIALISAKSRVADPLNLAYALILASTTAPDEQTSPEDKEIFAYALAVFFQNQNEDGSWPYSRPLFHYPSVGNAYCFEYELLAQLLDCKALRSELLPYIPSIARTAYLLEKTGFDLDSDSPGSIIAWASGHHPQIEGPESWSTASVYQFAHVFDRLVAEAIRRSAFAELGSIYTPPVRSKSPDDSGKFAERLLDADIRRLDGKVSSLKKTIAEKFVYPIAKEAHLVEKGEKLSADTPMSAILFGPPGTSKTQLAKHISDYLGWPLLSVDPSYLVQDGLDRIQAQANRLFSMLTVTEQVVVLLDEFDEMGRDRSRNQELLSRFITTAMLPKLASINANRQIVFLLATNFISGFDAAFSRGGRFDLLLQVMPPNLKAKLSHWPSVKSAYNRLSDLQKKKVRVCLTDLTFLETEQLSVKLIGVTAAGAIVDAFVSAQKAGTLSQKNKIDQTNISEGDETIGITQQASSDNEPTWKMTSASERERIRIPG